MTVLQIPKGCSLSNDSMVVTGAKGDPFEVPIIKNVEINTGNRRHIGNILLAKDADFNLLGWDIMVALGVGLSVELQNFKVKLYSLTAPDEEKIDPRVWYVPGEAGRLDIEPIRVEIERPEEPIRVKQYPLSMEGRRGLKPVIDKLIKKGTLEPCMSRHNTPILAVRKPDGSFRLVQDLWAVN